MTVGGIVPPASPCSSLAKCSLLATLVRLDTQELLTPGNKLWPMRDGRWRMDAQLPVPPWDDAEVCSVLGGLSPVIHSGNLLSNKPFIYSFPSPPSSGPDQCLLGVIPYISCLHLNPCLKVCFWGKPAEGRWVIGRRGLHGEHLPSFLGQLSQDSPS